MPTDGAQAHKILLSFEPLSRYGACWYYNWQAYKAAGASTSMGSTPTAYEAWKVTLGKHYDMNPPHGAAIWLGRRYDGNMDGDVFIAGPVDGQHAATDEPSYGQTGLTSIRARMALTGREYLGWTDHVLDCPIDLGGDGDDDMTMTPEQDNRLKNIENYLRLEGVGYGRPQVTQEVVERIEKGGIKYALQQDWNAFETIVNEVHALGATLKSIKEHLGISD
jgi:hypothetical protein